MLPNQEGLIENRGKVLVMIVMIVMIVMMINDDK